MNKKIKALLTILLIGGLIAGLRFFEESIYEETICKETEGQERNGLVYLPNQEEPFTGKNLCKYENGQNKAEGNYKDGKEEGKWTEWYANGQKWEESNYKDGKEEGKWTEWDYDGQIESKKNYKDGQLVR